MKSGKCLGCHDPHSSETPPLLIAEKASLCFECHKQEKLKHGKFSHSPFEENKCLSCHEVHSAEKAPLLKSAGKELCLSCHDSKATGSTITRAAARIDLKKKKVQAAGIPKATGARRLVFEVQTVNGRVRLIGRPAESKGPS